MAPRPGARILLLSSVGAPHVGSPMCSPFPRGHMVPRGFGRVAQGEQPEAEMVQMLLMLPSKAERLL